MVATSHRSGSHRASERKLAELAARQHSVFHRVQALEAGLTARIIDRRVTNGTWKRVHPSVYVVAGTPGPWRQRLMAACLAAGRGAVASHRSAAALWGFDGSDEAGIELTLVRVGRRPIPGVTIHRTRGLANADVTEVDGIPVTRPARTLIDLASVLDAGRLEAMLDSGLRDGQVSVAHLERRLAAVGSRGRPGADALSRLLARRRGTRPAESIQERRVAGLLMAAGLPEPVRQHELRDGSGALLARFDLAYPELRLAVEYDSYRHHFGHQAWRHDHARHNSATALDWLVLHVVDSDVAAVVDAYAIRVAAARA